MNNVDNIISSIVPAAEPASPAPPVEPLPISIMDVDFQCYEKWFAKQTDQKLAEFFTSDDVKYYIPPYPVSSNIEDPYLQKYLNFGYLSPTTIKYTEGDRLKIFGNESPEEYGKKVSDTKRIAYNFAKTSKIGLHSYPELKTLRGVLNYLEDLFEDKLWWMCQGKLLLLQEIHSFILDIYRIKAGYCYVKKRGGNTLVITNSCGPYARAQPLMEKMKKMKETNNLKDELFAPLAAITSSLETSFADYLPVDEKTAEVVITKANAYFKQNMDVVDDRLDKLTKYTKYIKNEYKRLENADDKEFLGAKRIYILELIRLYPRP